MHVIANSVCMERNIYRLQYAFLSINNSLATETQAQ